MWAENQKVTDKLNDYLESKLKNLIDDYILYFGSILTFPEEVFSSLKDLPLTLKMYAINQI